MVKITYIEQVADVIARKCSLWYYNDGHERIEIPYENVLSLTVKEILTRISQNNLYYQKAHGVP